MANYRTLFENIDWILIALLLFNSVLGVIFIYSSSHYLADNYYIRQMLWIVLSFLVLMVLLSVDYHTLVSYSFYLYGIGVVVLAGILMFGKATAGAKSWIKMPFFQIQPSEIVKIFVILALAHFFSQIKKQYLSLAKCLLSGGAVLLPIILIALQPDLGTALSYLPLFLAALILAGLNKRILIFFLILAFVMGIVGWNFLLKDYQKQRVKTLLFPGQDPLGAGYHILQSKIAVGSGGLWGKGYTKGTQSQLRFLPARHTDFIFSVIGEEFGFLGILFVMVFYSLLVSRLFRSISKSRDRAGVYIIFMVSFTLTIHFLINVLMTIGLFPITGIPLPLLSYGGSSLLANYLAVSLVINVKMRRFANV